MDYVLWENDKNEGDAFIYSGWPHEVPFSFFTGNRISGVVPPIEITMNERSQGRLTDNLLLTGSGRVFSQKLLGVLRSAGVDNIDTYPCTIRNLVTGEVHKDYSVVNVIGKIACIDRAQSELVFATGSQTEILGYHSIVLDESRIGGARLFLLAEMPVQIVAHATVADAIEEAEITGIEFVPQDVEDAA
jgi:uncharacterized protein DUF1629